MRRLQRLRRDFNEQIAAARREDDLMALADAVQGPEPLDWDTSHLPVGFGALTRSDVQWLLDEGFAI